MQIGDFGCTTAKSVKFALGKRLVVWQLYPVNQSSCLQGRQAPQRDDRPSEAGGAPIDEKTSIHGLSIERLSV